MAPMPETTAPVDPIENAVADGLIASRYAYLYAVYNLDAADAIDRLTSTPVPPQAPLSALALDKIQTLVDNGLACPSQSRRA